MKEWIIDGKKYVIKQLSIYPLHAYNRITHLVTYEGSHSMHSLCGQTSITDVDTYQTEVSCKKCLNKLKELKK